jgi:glycosyltransferase involved in cell wall biosynthesis
MASICIDGFNLAMPKGSGIATYGRNLLDAARASGLGTQVLYGPPAKHAASNVLNEALLVDARRIAPKATRRDKVKRFGETLLSQFGRSAYPITPSGEVIWPLGTPPAADLFWTSQDIFARANRCFQRYGSATPVTFKAAAEALPPDVMHWTSLVPVYARGCPNIYTFHDLIPLRLPHTTLGDKSRYMALSLEMAARADHIVVVSETTRQDVVRLLGVDEGRVTNTYQAVDFPKELLARSQDEVALELERVFNLGWKEYFLHFGAVEPKKNLGRIVEAYLSSGVTGPLVLVGGRSWLDEGETALLAQVKRDGVPAAGRILQYDYMSFPLLISMIRGAKAVLFPSLYEGFGLPVLEAMALSTAVLTSTGGALSEVAGDAAVIVDPYDVQAIAKGIQALDGDDGLRAELELRGRGQAAKFNPQAYRDRLLGAYSAIGVTPSGA